MLPAAKEITDFGEMWFIPASAVNTAIQTVEVIPLTRSVTPAEIGQIIDNVAAQVGPLKEEIRSLRAELAAYLKQQEERALEAAIKETSGAGAKAGIKGFFRRLFGKQDIS